MMIDRLLDEYDRGRLSRRALLSALAAAGVGALPARGQSASTFRAIGLNHIALSVTDVERSRRFYERHLGLRTTSQSTGSAFLDCGENFVALFRSSEPGLNHYSYSIPDYSQSDAARRLREVGLEPKLRGGRIYFDDPDGIEVQLSQG